MTCTSTHTDDFQLQRGLDDPDMSLYEIVYDTAIIVNVQTAQTPDYMCALVSDRESCACNSPSDMATYSREQLRPYHQGNWQVKLSH